LIFQSHTAIGTDYEYCTVHASVIPEPLFSVLKALRPTASQSGCAGSCGRTLRRSTGQAATYIRRLRF